MSHAAPPGWRLQVHETLASTQDAAMAAARAGQAGPLAILSREQSAGRGRAGRAWQAPSGNLNLSVLLRPHGMRPEPGFWALLAGIALFEAVASRAAADAALQLKWPNDLLLGGAKLGGILIDSAVSGSGFLEWVVVGMGVNLAAPPEVEGRQTASLTEAGPALDLAAEILRQLDIWLASDAPAVRDAWLRRAHPLGTLLEIATPGAVIAGAFAGLSGRGELLLQGHDAPIVSGDVCLDEEDPEPAPGHDS